MSTISQISHNSVIQKLCTEDFSQALAQRKVITLDFQIMDRGFSTWRFCKKNRAQVDSVAIAQKIDEAFRAVAGKSPSLITNSERLKSNIDALNEKFSKNPVKQSTLGDIFRRILQALSPSVNEGYTRKQRKSEKPKRRKSPESVPGLTPSKAESSTSTNGAKNDQKPSAAPARPMTPPAQTHQKDLKKLKETEGFAAQQQLVLAISAWKAGKTETSSQTILAPDMKRIAELEKGVPANIAQQYGITRELLYFSKEKKYYYNVVVRLQDQGGMPQYGFRRVEAIVLNRTLQQHTSDQFNLGVQFREQMEKMGLKSR